MADASRGDGPADGQRIMKTTVTKSAIIGQSIALGVAVGWILFGPALAAPADKDMVAESRRIVSQHKAVFATMPVGLAPYSTDAILLGNGDIAMSISSTPAAKGTAHNKHESGNLRFWFHKNDMWSGGARSVALIDACFSFDPAKPAPQCSAETDLYTAITSGTLAQAGGVTVRFKSWVSAVDNMIFLELSLIHI